MRGALAFIALACCATGAVAQHYESCTKVERGQFLAAVERAERLTLTATTAIGPNPSFQRWFGRYNTKKGEIVRRNLKAVAKALREEELSAVCADNGEGICQSDYFAFVDVDDHYVINLCPAFFEMETFKQLTAETVADGNGTRAGTIIHEVSHFTVVAQTEDICYSRVDCTGLAVDAPLDALLNADSYQYFVEDVTFFGVAGQPEK